MTPPLPPQLPHVPVMLAEVLEILAPRDGAIYVDATFGAGGYAFALLGAAACKVFGIDRDAEAIARGAERGVSAGRLSLRCGRFGEMAALLAAEGVERVDGIAFDLGVSSMQLDQPARGFSFRFDGPLDMRMGDDGAPTAAELVNAMPEAELARILFAFGEERAARRIARAIVQQRAVAPIASTARLAEICRRVLPKAADGIDPATRTFQALRIAVNDELGELDRGLAAAEQLLSPGGRLAVVSFHSLEDRRVKTFLKARSEAAARPSRHQPETQAAAPTFRLLARRAIRPGAAELAANPRARSARLRGAERTTAPIAPGPISERRVAA